MLESNGHSPLATREEFAQNYIAGGDGCAPTGKASIRAAR
jgi:hypothetical protein